MRVTGNRLIDVSQAATTTNQGKVAAAAAEASSGLRVQRPSDDPGAWLSAQRASVRRTLTEGASAAVASSRERLDEVDGALATIGDAVSAVRALAVQGASDSYTAQDRAGLAVQVRALFHGALAAANTRAADGEYLLAGSASLTAPFDGAGVYRGDAGTRQVPAIEQGTTIATISGTELTAGHGVDVLPLLSRIADALDADDLSALQAGLGELTTAVGQMALVRTHTGSAMNVLDATIAAHGELAENLTRSISNSVEADAIGAATRLAKASQALEVSRAVTAHVLALVGSQAG